MAGRLLDGDEDGLSESSVDLPFLEEKNEKRDFFLDSEEEGEEPLLVFGFDFVMAIALRRGSV